MRILYSLGIYTLGLVLRILSFFNEKIKLGVKGRYKTFGTLETDLNPDATKIWFHCASLGEYEQGLPVFESIIENYPEHQIVLSFFSPSGYEIRKEKSIADIVVYLPLDTPANAKRFVQKIQPELTVFTKYDIWPNMLVEIGKTNSKTYLISALFRKQQSYFKWYGGLMKTALQTFDHIFTQNFESKNLLESIGFKNASVSGDTRFDRVSDQLKIDNSVSFLKTFTQNELTIVFGSSWPEDDEIYIPFINSFSEQKVKYIIAPHKISDKYTRSLMKRISKKTISFSSLEQLSDSDLQSADIFILDTIGYLSKAYSYADMAFVGGASGHTGLHNILEPAVFGIPICIGMNYSKFPEAVELIKIGGAISVSNSKEFEDIISSLVLDPDKRSKIGKINSDYVRENAGAVNHIMKIITDETL